MKSFQLKPTQHEAFLFQARFLWGAQKSIEKCLPSTHTDKFQNFLQQGDPEAYKFPFQLEDPTFKQLSGDVPELVSEFNYHHRLKVSDVNQLDELKSYQKHSKSNIVPCQTPAEYVDDSKWATGSSDDQKNWLGHGYYWKAGEGELCKDVGAMDYDSIEHRWHKIKQPTMLVADYSSLRKDFAHLIPSAFSDEQIDQWLIDQVAYFSEGQVKRISKGGDLHNLLEVSDISDIVDPTQTRSAFRLRGGGRAAIFPVNDAYHIHPEGRVEMDLLDVKGIGTTILQPDISPKACGFLNFVDALKEMSYQKLLQRLAEREKESTWSTVCYYAIIDTGLRFKKDVPNPATGYKGDRCVLVVRQAQSRIVSCFDEIVFYSVARIEQIQNNTSLINFRKVLQKYGLSSEQCPQALCQPSSHRTEFTLLKDNLEGGWNIQCDAPMTHLVDFSHFYTLPFSTLSPQWKMSDQACKEALKLGSPHLGVFQNPALCEYTWGTADPAKAQTLFEQEKNQTLEAKWKPFGKCGARKPDNSWSWLLETDDSPIMDWCMKEGMSFFPSSSVPRNHLFETIVSWLPPVEEK